MAAIVSSPATDEPEPLFSLQLQVARKADELARSEQGNGMSLHCWLLAEAEILEGASVMAANTPSERAEA